MKPSKSVSFVKINQSWALFNTQATEKKGYIYHSQLQGLAERRHRRFDVGVYALQLKPDRVAFELKGKGLAASHFQGLPQHFFI